MNKSTRPRQQNELKKKFQAMNNAFGALQKLLGQMTTMRADYETLEKYRKVVEAEYVLKQAKKERGKYLKLLGNFKAASEAYTQAAYNVTHYAN